MLSDQTHGDRVQYLLENPDEFEKVASHYDSHIDCYYSLRDRIASEASTVDEYFKFFEIFGKQGPTGFVQKRIRENAARSIKNMLLGTSTAGQKFRIYTLADATSRVDAFRDLGATELTLRDVVETTVEELYEEHPSVVYDILESLLREVPDGATYAVEPAVRALAVAASKHSNTPDFNSACQEYRSRLPTPDLASEYSTAELRDQQEECGYEDNRLVDISRALVAAEPSNENFTTYLYHSGRQTIEEFRHGSTNPSGAMLQLASRQLSQLAAADQPVSESSDWIQYYDRVSEALTHTAIAYESTQDPQRVDDANFFAAAMQYYRAAEAIQTQSLTRATKALNKSFRNAQLASDELAAAEELCDIAEVMLTQLGFEREDLSAREQEAIEASRHRQSQWRATYRAERYVNEGQFGRVNNAVRDAQEAHRQHDIVEREPYRLRQLALFSEAYSLEEAEEFEAAAIRYDEGDMEFDGNDLFELCREIAELKKDLTSEEEDPIETATSQFGSESIITQAVKAAEGESLTERPRECSTLPVGIDTPERKYRVLVTLLPMYSIASENRIVLSEHIKQLLLSL